jgi:hypothetical protein
LRDDLRNLIEVIPVLEEPEKKPFHVEGVEQETKEVRATK